MGEEEGGKFVQLDPQSEGGLDGSSEEPFGPMVRLLLPALVPLPTHGAVAEAPS